MQGILGIPVGNPAVNEADDLDQCDAGNRGSQDE